MRKMITRWGRGTALLALFTLVPMLTSGCFGRFELTRKIYDFNQTVSPDKWTRWLVFLVMAVFPYPVAVLVDAVFANSVEFWKGKNPINVSTHTFYGKDGELARVTFNTDRTVDIVSVDAQGTVEEFTIRREGDALAARNADGRLLARVTDVNGVPQMVQGVER